MIEEQYRELLLLAQTLALSALAVALVYLAVVLVRVATALQRLQATRLAVLQVDQEAPRVVPINRVPRQR
jgi:hypothetical protein